MSVDRLPAQVSRFSNFAALYDASRPAPPRILLALLASLRGRRKIHSLLDLGCGTGLSTRYWSDKATTVVGCDPNPDMIAFARERDRHANTTYRQAYAHDTGMPDGSVDVVTCGNSLHWMDPKTTFGEVARVLRAGGALMAYDIAYPPATGELDLDRAYQDCITRALRCEQNLPDLVPSQWPKANNLERIRQSGFFTYTRQFHVHQTDRGTPARLVNILRSQGVVQGLTAAGVSEDEFGIPEFLRLANERDPHLRRPWLWSATISVGLV